jgi:hypothetical protein
MSLARTDEAVITLLEATKILSGCRLELLSHRQSPWSKADVRNAMSKLKSESGLISRPETDTETVAQLKGRVQSSERYVRNLSASVEIELLAFFWSILFVALGHKRLR